MNEQMKRMLEKELQEMAANELKEILESLGLTDEEPKKEKKKKK